MHLRQRGQFLAQRRQGGDDITRIDIRRGVFASAEIQWFCLDPGTQDAFLVRWTGAEIAQALANVVDVVQHVLHKMFMLCFVLDG